MRRLSQTPKVDSYSSDTLSSVSFNNELAKIQSSEVLDPQPLHSSIRQRIETSSSSFSLPTTLGYKNDNDDDDDNPAKQATSRSRSLDLQSHVESDRLFRNEFTTAQVFCFLL